MRKLLVTAMLGTMFIVVGCKDGKMWWDKDKDAKKADMEMSAKDACPHCPGVQSATADGKCSKCGMKVSG
ncbi:MAG: hypothetical protein ABIP55_00490 [Tepidisphaeraceae bacterium]